MWRLIKTLFILVLLAGVALVAYAYVGPLFFPGDFAPPTTQVTKSVTLETK
jgi:predicted small lipoprotein YifL|tara:strand:- start:371 stop:523 length:153 start_codon:yes stop_codon:yes gene_type:complete